MDEAIGFLTALGPAGEILRLQGDRAAHLHDRVGDALVSGLADLATPTGVIGHASTWLITATNPGHRDAWDPTDPLAVAPTPRLVRNQRAARRGPRSLV